MTDRRPPRLSKQGSVLNISDNPLESGPGETIAINNENLHDCTPLTDSQLKDIMKLLRSTDENSKRIELLQEAKQPYLFHSSDLWTIVGITTSLKTKMSFIHMLGPRLLDPAVMSEKFKSLFRFSEEKAEVEHVLKARTDVIRSSQFTRSALAGPVGGGRGRGRGRGAGLVAAGGRGGGGGRGGPIRPVSLPQPRTTSAATTVVMQPPAAATCADDCRTRGHLQNPSSPVFSASKTIKYASMKVSSPPDMNSIHEHEHDENDEQEKEEKGGDGDEADSGLHDDDNVNEKVDENADVTADEDHVELPIIDGLGLDDTESDDVMKKDSFSSSQAAHDLLAADSASSSRNLSTLRDITSQTETEGTLPVLESERDIYADTGHTPKATLQRKRSTKHIREEEDRSPAVTAGAGADAAGCDSGGLAVGSASASDYSLYHRPAKGNGEKKAVYRDESGFSAYQGGSTRNGSASVDYGEGPIMTLTESSSDKFYEAISPGHLARKKTIENTKEAARIAAQCGSGDATAHVALNSSSHSLYGSFRRNKSGVSSTGSSPFPSFIRTEADEKEEYGDVVSTGVENIF